jgi:hypothetical protein
VTTTATLTRQRKVEIDTRIAELQHELWRTEYPLANAAESIHLAAEDKKVTAEPDEWGRKPAPKWAKTLAECIALITPAAESASPDEYSRERYALAKYAEIVAQRNKLTDEMHALDEVWREHRWSRFYYVQNQNGHIHEDMYCSTCYATTEYQWLTDLSDQTEAEAVASFGEVLCSVCYPSAPTEWTDGEPHAKKAARDEAAKRKAERTAKKLEKALLPDGSDTVLTATVYGRHWDGSVRQFVEGEYVVTKKITTLAQARTWLREISDARATGSDWTFEREAWSPENEAWVVAAIAAKIDSTPEAVLTEAMDKAAKKAKKDGY